MAMTKACPECGQSLHHLALKCRCGWADKEAKTAKDDGRPAGACTAYGCPLGGTIFNTMGPGGEGWCPMHYRHSELDLQLLTKAIRARAELFIASRNILASVSQMDWWLRKIPLHFKRAFAGREDLRPTDAEWNGLIPHWERRVFETLERECLAELGVQLDLAPKHVYGAGLRPFELLPEDLAAQMTAEAEIASRDAAGVI